MPADPQPLGSRAAEGHRTAADRSSPDDATRFDRSDWWLIAAVSLISFAPLVAHWREFATLFWISDDMVVLDDLAHNSFGVWLTHLFAENFIPVFKLAWGAALYGGDRHYFVLIVACWATHALNVGLLTAWLRRSGFSRVGAALVALVFGLSASNIETLGWAIQWSPVLSTFFLLIAFLLWNRALTRPGPPSARATAEMTLACAASALSFARGILSGIVIGLMWLAERGRKAVARERDAGPVWRHLLFVGVVALPCLICAVVVLRSVPPNTALLSAGRAEHWRRIASFAGYYLGLNPLPHLFQGFFPPLSPLKTTAYVAAKMILIVAGLKLASPNQRRALCALLLHELGYAAQLGLGRWSLEGFLGMSSRYQYASLLSFFPFVAVVLESLLRNLPSGRMWRPLFATVSLGTAAWTANRLWTPLLPAWVEWRGASARRALFERAPQPNEPDIAGVPAQNARRLTKHFDLR